MSLYLTPSPLSQSAQRRDPLDPRLEALRRRKDAMALEAPEARAKVTP